MGHLVQSGAATNVTAGDGGAGAETGTRDLVEEDAAVVDLYAQISVVVPNAM